ncbi:Gfo/Idh/MocA family protein [Paucisalibacillus sp. EB02]|uniref:Gfo/Idh/MocA family protein n=1 Tax=Paucisalibacillus sp. EB02 TaxID=1347087 RepID=UPI0004B23F27|nr:Gfo/Idh/MocA family oxidoreductase [Paucisalibacillus sp. EB02]
MKYLKLGIIGLDTSHVTAFTKLLHHHVENYHVSGARVKLAYPGGSPHLSLSMSRLKAFSEELNQTYGVPITDSIQKVAAECDAILIESVDGGAHLEQLREVVSYQKPIFIDKPFALNAQEAKEMIQLAEKFQTPIMSTSALRYADALTRLLKKYSDRTIIGADCFGPMEVLEEIPGLFWYGIHTVEMLYTIMGCGAETLQAVKLDNHDCIMAVWKDGRIGTIRGKRVGNHQFGAVIHYEDGSEFVAIRSEDKPFYASLLEEIIGFFRDGKTRVPLEETGEIIRFIEAANKGRDTGEVVAI